MANVPLIINQTNIDNAGKINSTLINYAFATANDPGSYPEYLLLAKANSSNWFQLIGDIYGFRGSAGERNVWFAITCSKTDFPSTQYYARAMPGSASQTATLVTLTYSGNTWLAIRLDSNATVWGGISFRYTGFCNHNEGVSTSTMLAPGSVASGSVSGVTVISTITTSS